MAQGAAGVSQFYEHVGATTMSYTCTVPACCCQEESRGSPLSHYLGLGEFLVTNHKQHLPIEVHTLYGIWAEQFADDVWRAAASDVLSQRPHCTFCTHLGWNRSSTCRGEVLAFSQLFPCWGMRAQAVSSPRTNSADEIQIISVRTTINPTDLRRTLL